MDKGGLMKYLAFALILLSATAAMAEPFLTCDPQDGIDKYIMTCPNVGYTVDIIALTGGVLEYDIATFPGGQGWHDCTIAACGYYQVEDTATGNITQKYGCSDPSAFRLKIPNKNSASNFMIQ